MKYRARFTPLWSPDIDLNPTTSERNFHLPSLTSIQCAVTPRNVAFVVLRLHPSAVVEINPGVAFKEWVSQCSHPNLELGSKGYSPMGTGTGFGGQAVHQPLGGAMATLPAAM